jgi:hypothetical protein
MMVYASMVVRSLLLESGASLPSFVSRESSSKRGARKSYGTPVLPTAQCSCACKTRCTPILQADSPSLQPKAAKLRKEAGEAKRRGKLLGISSVSGMS